MDTLITVPQTVSIAVGAGLIGVTGYRPLLALAAAVMSGAAAYLLAHSRPRAAVLSAAMTGYRATRDDGLASDSE